ncbi:MAG: hypothetical protein MUF21_05625, partial [Gemmatimonadaceae bacterium]|nr:hypothetical protein [Gemmatimonadaceae bacterium]
MTEISALLTENRRFAPPEPFRRQAAVNTRALYDEAARDPEAFWARQAAELEWIRPWTKVL